MKKELTRIAWINGIFLLVGFLFGLLLGGLDGVLIGIGAVLFITSVINLLIGLGLLIASITNKNRRATGLAMLLFGSIGLLCGFTLCSNFSFLK